jgi:hypothetical protein
MYEHGSVKVAVVTKDAIYMYISLQTHVIQSRKRGGELLYKSHDHFVQHPCRPWPWPFSCHVTYIYNDIYYMARDLLTQFPLTHHVKPAKIMWQLFSHIYHVTVVIVIHGCGITWRHTYFAPRGCYLHLLISTSFVHVLHLT